MEASSNTYRIENKCPSRIWYRIYTEKGGWTGHDLGKDEKTELGLSGPIDTLRGFKWEKGEEEVFPSDLPAYKLDPELETKVTLSPIFGPRPTRSIKVFMACLAGPADPATRNDTTLIEKFKEAGVPQDNIWCLLERQCTPKSIIANLSDAASENISHENDIMLIYLGGHGNGGSGKDYSLATWEGFTMSGDVLRAISKCKAEIFMVVDSCHSGAMIDDAKRFFGSEKSKPKMTILTSTQADNSACTGWKLIQMLVDHVGSGKYITPASVGQYVVDNLKTSLETQKAQLATI